MRVRVRVRVREQALCKGAAMAHCRGERTHHTRRVHRAGMAAPAAQYPALLGLNRVLARAPLGAVTCSHSRPTSAQSVAAAKGMKGGEGCIEDT